MTDHTSTPQHRLYSTRATRPDQEAITGQHHNSLSVDRISTFCYSDNTAKQQQIGSQRDQGASATAHEP